MVKIGFATNDWSRSFRNEDGSPCLGGSGHVRTGQYILPLRKLGYNVTIGSLAYNHRNKVFGIQDFYGNDRFDYDIIILQRYMHEGVLRDMKLAQKSGQIIINDVDDWYWGLSDLNAAKKATDPNLNPKENINIYKNILIESDGVISSTPFLQEKIKEWNTNTIMHQNYVEWSCIQ